MFPLAQPPAVRRTEQRHMRIRRRPESEQLLQVDLPRRGGEQVIPTHHLRDAHRGIVHHNGKLIGKDAVGAAQDEVAAVAVEIFFESSLQPVVHAVDRVRHKNAPRGPPRLRSALRLRQIPAGARVDGRAVRGGALAAWSAARVQ